MRKQYIIALFAFLSIFLINAPANAATPKVIGEYDDWIAYYIDEPTGRVCYMASTPKKDEGKYTVRGDIYSMVTHRPKEGSFDVVSFIAGYNYKADSAITVRIGSAKFKDLFASLDKAWALDEDTDKALVRSMKRGYRMIVNGISSRGTKTKDTYSLKGFASAYKAINSKCPKKK